MLKNNNEKGFAPLVVLLTFVGLAIVTGFIYFVSTNKSTNTQVFTDPLVAGSTDTVPNLNNVQIYILPKYPTKRFDVHVYWQSQPFIDKKFNVQLRVDGKVYNKVGSNTLDDEYGSSGGGVTFGGLVLPSIPVTATVTVDSKNVVSESNENDNTTSFLYEGDVDLRWVNPSATIDALGQINFTGGVKNFGRANAVFASTAPVAGLHGIAASVKDKDTSGIYFYRKSMPMFKNYFQNWPANNILKPGETLRFAFSVNHLGLKKNDTVELMVNDCTRLGTGNATDNYHFLECYPLQIVENVGLFNNTVNITIQ